MLHLANTRPPLVAPLLLAGLGLTSCNTFQTTDSATTTTTDSATAAAPADSAMAATPMAVKPTGPAPAWATGIRPEMLAVVETLASLSRR